MGPLRVWLRYENKPGLAMTRSVGDMVARTVGVVPTPEIHEHRVNLKTDIGMIICSDGVYEFLTN